jgi:hypothetical protein
MSEVHRPRLFFIDSNIPAFTPGLHKVQDTLDLSENVALLPVGCIEPGVVRKEG